MQKAKVLIVEDEILVAKDISATLQKLGYSVTSVASLTDEAIKKAENESPDLILMDIVLGKNNKAGIEAATHIRSRLGIPVVYITAHSDRTTFEAAKNTEPYGYILKPVEESTLKTAVEIALHKHKIDKELNNQQNRLRAFMDTDTDALCFIDSNLDILDVNKAGLESWNLKREDIVGKNLLDFVERGQKKRWENLLKKVMETGKQFSLFGVPTPYQYGDRVIDIKVFKAGDGLGLIITDVTMQKRAEIDDIQDIVFCAFGPPKVRISC